MCILSRPVTIGVDGQFQFITIPSCVKRFAVHFVVSAVLGLPQDFTEGCYLPYKYRRFNPRPLQFFLLSRDLKDEIIVFFLQVFKLFLEVGFLVIKFSVKLNEFLAGKAKMSRVLILNVPFKIPPLYLPTQHNSVVKF